MPALPGCIISDLYADLSASGTMVGLASTITAMANVSPLFVRQSGGDWREQANIAVSTHTITGEWTIILPSQTNCEPDSVTWAITLPDGTTWSGAVTDAMVTASQSTALRLHDLKDTYGWALATPSPVTALSTYIATATALGMVTLDQNPSSGNPVVLTAPRRGAALGLASLDAQAHVPLGQLAGVVIPKGTFNAAAPSYDVGDLVTSDDLSYLCIQEALPVTAASYHALILASSPVAYYPLDSGDAHDATGHGHDGGSLPGGVVDSSDGPPIGGHSLDFSGASTGIAIADASGFPASGSMSIEVWLKVPGTGRWGTFVSWGDVAGSGTPSGLIYAGLAVFPSVEYTPEIYDFTNGHLGQDSSWFPFIQWSGAPNTWYHVVLVANAATGAGALYVNGLPVYPGSVAYNPLSLSPASATSGWIGMDTPLWHNVLPGKLAHLAIYDRALSAQEVAAHALYGTIVPPSVDPDTWLPLDPVDEQPSTALSVYFTNQMTVAPGDGEVAFWGAEALAGGALVRATATVQNQSLTDPAVVTIRIRPKYLSSQKIVEAVWTIPPNTTQTISAGPTAWTSPTSFYPNFTLQTTSTILVPSNNWNGVTVLSTDKALQP